MSGEPSSRRPAVGANWTSEPRRRPGDPVADPAAGREELAEALCGAAGGQRLFGLSEELGRLADEIAEFGVPAPASAIDAGFVRALIRERQQRSALFGADLFADPVWDMMLDLLAARLEGRAVRTSSLCIAAGVPTTTALRWVRILTERGLFVRVPDPLDGRGVLIELSDDTAERLLAHLAAGAGAGL